jgi:antitoxin ParD1/3/4
MLLAVGVMATLNISLPEGMKVFVESQVRKGESYTSASDYVRALIREDQKRKAEEKEALLLEGLGSGEPIEANAAWWKKKKEELLESHRTKGNGRRKK